MFFGGVILCTARYNVTRATTTHEQNLMVAHRLYSCRENRTRTHLILPRGVLWRAASAHSRSPVCGMFTTPARPLILHAQRPAAQQRPRPLKGETLVANDAPPPPKTVELGAAQKELPDNWEHWK
jgi:hypothetical protein